MNFNIKIYLFILGYIVISLTMYYLTKFITSIILNKKVKLLIESIYEDIDFLGGAILFDVIFFYNTTTFNLNYIITCLITFFISLNIIYRLAIKFKIDSYIDPKVPRLRKLYLIIAIVECVIQESLVIIFCRQ